MIIRVVFILILLSGCAYIKPYAEAGLSWRSAHYTDELLRANQGHQCDDPRFDFEAGVEFKNGVKVGGYHESMVLCGGPFNDEPELYENGIRISGEVGGWDD